MNSSRLYASSNAASFYSNFAAEEQLQSALHDSSRGMFTPSPSNSFSSGLPSPESNYDFDDSPMDRPMLQITEQPVSSFRFRYRSEMQGAHGSLLGRGQENSRKRCYPSVRLLNYDGEARIRCSLYTADKKKPHMHQMITKVNNQDVLDHEQLVSERNGYRVEFKGLGIVHMSKKHLKDELIRRKEIQMMEELKRDDRFIRLSDGELRAAIAKQRPKISEEAERETKTIDPNKVRLCFEAFVRDERGRVKYICEKVFSGTIQNMKSAETGELKICRMDKYMGTCRGGDEVFILVEKVCKKNIQVRFFEEEDGKEVWSDLAHFQEYDVHHQYAIVFRTPPYRDQELTSNKEVKIQLYRPKNRQYSEPVAFTYKPAMKYGKRPHRNGSLSSTESSRSLLGFCAPSEKRMMMRHDADPMFNSNSNSLRSLESISSQTIREFLKGSELNCDPIASNEVEFLNSAFFESYVNAGEDVPQEVVDMLVPESERPCLSSESADALLRHLDLASETLIGGPPSAEVQMEYDGMLSVQADGVEGNRRRKCKAKFLKGLTSKKSPRAPTVEWKSRGKKSFINSTLVEPVLVEHQSGPLLEISREPSSVTLAKKVYPTLAKLVTSKDHSRTQEIKKLLGPKGYEDGPLHTAAMHGQVKELGDILSLLIRRSLLELINTVNWEKETPLMYAVKFGQLDCVKLLLLAGADCSLVDNKENTTFHLAVKHHNLKCLQELLYHKSAQNSDNEDKEAVQRSLKLLLEKKDESGHTAVHDAVSKKDLDAVKLLLKAGANINAKSAKSGNTPLHIAVDVGSLIVAEYILKNTEVNVNERNLNGNTALELAELRHRPKLLSLLKKFCQGTSPRDIDDISQNLHGIEVKDEPLSDDDDDDEDGGDEEEECDDDTVEEDGNDEDDDEYENALQIDEGDSEKDDDYVSNDKINMRDDEEHLAKKLPRILSKGRVRDVKDEPPSSPYSAATHRRDHLLDDRTSKIVCDILDRTKKWEKMARMLNSEFLIGNIGSMPSPSKCLIGYIECDGKVSVGDIRNVLKKLGEPEAVRAIDEMLDHDAGV